MSRSSYTSDMCIMICYIVYKHKIKCLLCRILTNNNKCLEQNRTEQQRLVKVVGYLQRVGWTVLFPSAIFAQFGIKF